jgi:hypothetical protein
MDWLKSSWKWILAGFAVLLAMLVGVSRRDPLAAVREADAAAREAEKKAAELNAKANQLAAQMLAEQIRLEAEKEKMKNASPSDVDAFLRDRGALRK